MSTQQKELRGFIGNAYKIREDRMQLETLVRLVKRIIVGKQTKFGKVLDKILILIRLLKNYAGGRYHQIAPYRMVLVIAALLYIVSPFDAIFDFLPGGYLDDAAIVIWLFNNMRKEISSFMEWEKSKERDNVEIII